MNITYTRPYLTPYQRAIIDSEARFTITEAGTKTGKTASHIIWLFEQALRLKHGQSAWWVAPVYGQAEIAFKRMRNQLSNKNFFRANESKLQLYLPNGACVAFKSAEKPDNLYGDDVYAAVFDEFTRAREAAWFALRSTLTATNAKCKLIGNAKGKKNWGYLLGQKARNGEPGYEYHRITCWDAVAAGILKQEEIEQAMRDLPEHVFKELYLAEPSDDGSNPFGIDFINRYTMDLQVGPAAAYGIDLAKSVDWTVVVGVNFAGRICYFDRFQHDWHNTKARLRQIPNLFDTPTAIDATGVGDPTVEELQREFPKIEGFKYNSQSKQNLMLGLATALQQGNTSVLEGVHREEMEQFEYVHTPTGVRYSAPVGAHDDTVNAHGLALYKFNRRGTGIYNFM